MAHPNLTGFYRGYNDPNEGYIDDTTFCRSFNTQNIAFSQAAKPFDLPGPSHPVNRTAPNAEGYVWLETTIETCQQHLNKAVLAGHEGNDAVYVGRTRIENEVIPCKVIPSKNRACYTYNMKTRPVTTFELYCRNTPRVNWMRSKDGAIPRNAVEAGKTFSNEKLYVGRVKVDNKDLMGYIQPSTGSCLVSIDDVEQSFSEYEVMILVD